MRADQPYIDRSCDAFAGIEQAIGFSPKFGASGRDLTTFCIGGSVRCLLEPGDRSELITTLDYLRLNGIEYKMLGAGSNLLIPDHGISGACVIRLTRLFRSWEELGDGEFQVGAATSLMALSRELSIQGFAGLEFAGGIPGSFGGAIRMNAGAHGGEIKDILREVEYILPSGEILQQKREDLSFSYRRCEIPKDAIIIGGKISLNRSDKSKVMARRRECLEYRKTTQPLTSPTAGSVFRNPNDSVSAGFLIEKAGLKGSIIGGAKISDLHANWITNEDRTALSSDVEGLINLCRERISKEFGIDLETEIVRW